MKRVCLAVLLACGSLWCGHAYGYLPEVDSITGLCTFKKEVQISELTDKEAYAGSIGPTDEKGSTPISFSWQNPATKANESVCWSAKVWRNRYDPFSYDGHFYDRIMISSDGAEIEIWADGGIFIMRGKLAEAGGGDSSVGGGNSSANGASASSAWQSARSLKGVATDSSGVRGIFELKCGKVGKSGIVRISASLTGLDGKKKNYKTQNVAVSNGTAIVSWPQNGDKLRVTITGEKFSGSGGGLSVRDAVIGGISSWDVLVFSVENVSLKVPDGYKLLDVDSLYSWGGGEPVYVDRTTGRWSCRKPMAAKYVEYREGMPMPACCSVEPSESYLNVACDCSAENRLGLTLTYAPWQGSFKGSFRLYATRESGKKGFKSYRVNVTGIVVDGKGYGRATCKSPSGGPWAVTVQ